MRIRRKLSPAHVSLRTNIDVMTADDRCQFFKIYNYNFKQRCYVLVNEKLAKEYAKKHPFILDTGEVSYE